MQVHGSYNLERFLFKLKTFPEEILGFKEIRSVSPEKKGLTIILPNWLVSFFSICGSGATQQPGPNKKKPGLLANMYPETHDKHP